MRKHLFFTALLFATCFGYTRAQCIPDSVRYSEDFNGLAADNDLPLCWAASNPSVTCLTYTAGNGKAAFYSSPGAANYFYSAPLYLQTSVVYSISVWYRTDAQSPSNWADFTLMLGSSQSTMGLSTLTTVSNPFTNNQFKSLSTTFSVTNNSVYYVAIRAISAGSATAQYLHFDDLMVEIPCTVSANLPNILISPPTPTICNGDTIVLTASGAGSYTWGSGEQTSTTTANSSGSIYSVKGTGALTGCTASASVYLAVKPNPNIALLPVPPTVCQGKSAVILATGSPDIKWSNGMTGPSITVTPQSNITLTGTSTAANGCKRISQVNIQVTPNPEAASVEGNTLVCSGDGVSLKVVTPYNYTWWRMNELPQSGPISATLTATSSYSVLVISNLGCTTLSQVQVKVEACTSSLDNSIDRSINLVSTIVCDELKITHSNGSTPTIRIYDLTGKSINELKHFSGQTINVTHLIPGIYFLKTETTTLRFIKM